MTQKENTFGDYKFADWIPVNTRESIRNFWGCFGRTYKDWLKSPSEQRVMERSAHGPGPNGFGMPPNGATVFFFIKDWKLSKGKENCVYERIRGRYLHKWNNIGSLIDNEGKDHGVSTCDCWLRIYEEDKN